MAAMQTPEATFFGPVRPCPQSASRDYEKLLHMREIMTPKALVDEVYAWDGAKVGKGYKGRLRRAKHLHVTAQAAKHFYLKSFMVVRNSLQKCTRNELWFTF